MHKRALWAAMRQAGGDANHAAKALGITVTELLDLLDGDPASMWRADEPGRFISGRRAKTIVEDDAPPSSDDDPDGSAW
jgi:hypothetical protein